jgi:membrane associated rhomboid family serine protease
MLLSAALGLFNDYGFWPWFKEARLLIDMLIVAWLINAVNLLLFQGLVGDFFSLRPRNILSLPNILFRAIFHSNWGHFWGNAVGYLIFGSMIVLRDARDVPIVSLCCALFSGMALWLTGSGRSYYRGASSMIFGYMGYVLTLVYMYRDPWAIGWFTLILLSFFFGDLLVIPVFTGNQKWAFGQMIWGMLPIVPRGVAWTGHLFGFLGGVWTALHIEQLRPIVAWIQGAIGLSG